MKTAIETDGQLIKDCRETDHANGTMRESPQNSPNFTSQSAFMVLIARECGINAGRSGRWIGGHGGGQFLHQLGSDHRCHAINVPHRV